MNKNSNILAAYSLFLCMLGSNVAVAYEEQELFSPHATATVKYDDNVFLLSDQESAADTIGESNKSDVIFELGAGVRTNIKSREQRYQLNANVFQREYNRFDRLDFTGGSLGARWVWALNKKLDGVVSYNFNKDQSSLNDQRLPTADSFDLNRLSLKVNRHISSRSDIYFLTSFKKKEYKERQVLDNERTNVAVGYKYFTGKKNSIAFELGTSEGKYLNRFSLAPNEPILNSFDEDVVLVKTRWQLSPRATVNAEAGYISRSHDDALSEFDYDGLIVDLRFKWEVGTRTELVSSYSKQLNDTENTLSLFTNQDRLSVEATWLASDKLELSAGIMFKEIDYTQRLGNTRDDDVSTIELKSRYRLHPLFNVELALRSQSRDSTSFVNEFDKAIASISLLYNPPTD